MKTGATVTDGALLALAVLAPMATGVAVFMLPMAARVLLPTGWLLTTGLLALPAARYEAPLHYDLGDWQAALGISLQADGIALLMLLLTALMLAAVFVHARAWFAPETGEQRAFWPLACLLWSALNAAFLFADLFNLFVALELLSICAVGLAAVGGREQALRAALRYMMAVLVSSNLLLLAITLLYAGHGVLALDLLADRLAPGAAPALALALLTVALMLKTALVPLHYWLPPAHAAASAPASALLSGLVIKAGFLALLRLWLELAPALEAMPAARALAAVGAVAVLWGSAAALAEQRLKTSIAYSTVAQVGYLFLCFAWIGNSALTGLAMQAAALQVMAHALAKAAMFLAAGGLIRAAGRDDLDALRGAAAREPRLVFAFGIAAASLVGLPPSLGFAAKWQLLEIAFSAGDGAIAAVILVGSLLSAANKFRMLRLTFAEPAPSHAPCPPALQWPPLMLAMAAAVGGLFAAAIAEHFGLGTVAP